MLNYSTPLDGVFRALADPSRRMIVEALTRGPATVSELAKPLPMSMPAVIQHLQVLEHSGLIKSAKVGRQRICRIETATLQTAERWFASRRADWERRLDRLGDFLGEPRTEKGNRNGRKVGKARHHRR